MKRRIISVILIGLLIMSLTGCSNSRIKKGKFDSKTPAASIASGVVAENSEYRLLWNDDKKFVALENRKTGEIWSAVPYEYYSDGGSSAAVNSSVNIRVNNANTMMNETLRGYTEANEGGRIFSKRIKNGVRVVYCFDNYKISVTVDYTLEADHLKTTVDPKRIVEGGEFQLVSVSLAPYLCSAKNETNESYLFVPTGSGGLMYPDVRAEGKREYSGEVYGDEATRIMPEDILDDESVYMPVFGAKNGDTAILGVIDEGAELASVEAEAGNSKTGYSTVYPTFSFRGYDLYPTTLWVFNRQDIQQTSSVMSASKVSVNYYPLFGKDAGYEGMAARYRSYLVDSEKMAENKNDDELYHLEIIGGSLVDTAAWGIPHKKLSVLTSFAQAKQIVETALSKTDKQPVVSLSGFGSSGLNIGKIADGYKFDSRFGKAKSLFDYCDSVKVPVFVNYDLIRFNKSGSGFSYLKNSARSASLHIAELYNINLPLRDYDKDTGYRFLSREKLIPAAEKLKKAAEKQGIKNISLSSLGQIAYSDFSDSAYAVKGNMGKDVSHILSMLSKGGFGVSVDGGNVYAAVKAQKIFSAPLDNGDYIAFDASVPFYQMVFGGYKSLYSDGINSSANVKKRLMQAVSFGVRPSFTVAENCDILTSVSSDYRIYGTQWADVENTVCEYVKKYADYYSKISKSRIIGYEFLENNVTKTVFENGISVYANHSEKPVQSEVGEIEGYGLCIK